MTCPVKGCPFPKHSAGPWVIVGERHMSPDYWSKAGWDDLVIAVPHENGPWETIHVRSLGNAYGLPDAALIARAPDLAHALVGLVQAARKVVIDSHHADWCTNCTEARVALAAAEAALKGDSDA